MLDPSYCNKEVAEKVAYEFHMFAFLWDEIFKSCVQLDAYVLGEPIFSGSGSSWGEDEAAWAMLEAYLLHTRVLYEFFTSTKRYKDNILPSDYTDKWVPADPKSFVYLNEDRIKRLNKTLAHLAKERIEFNDGWNVTAIHSEIDEMIQRFRSMLSDKPKLWFSESQFPDRCFDKHN